MGSFFPTVAKMIFNAGYYFSCRVWRRDPRRVLFVSRQTDKPSYDFLALAHDLERRGWSTHIHVKKLTKRAVLSYMVHIACEIRYLAQSTVVVLDRYDPVVSLIDFEYEQGACLPVNDCANNEFPQVPVVVQIWHAFGAFKKFGFQSVDTLEGHPLSTAKLYGIHRNYSWVICSGERCRKAYSEAFSYPIQRVISAYRPEFDKLLSLRSVAERCDEKNANRLTILFAPTLRKSQDSVHPFRDLFERRDMVVKKLDANLIWSFHPLENDLPAPGDVSDDLIEADIVVTDYSSIVYEAYLLGKKVFFYVPDIEQYRLSPGLNTDPCAIAPGLCARTEQDLLDRLNAVVNTGTYDYSELEKMVEGVFDEGSLAIADCPWFRIAD